MKRIFVLLFGMALALCDGFAQPSTYYQAMLDDDIRLAQRPGTEALLRDYLAPAAAGADTVTALFLIPAACPRCEAVIPHFLQTMRAVCPAERVVLVSCFDDPVAAARYLRQQHFGETLTLFDTSHTFDRVFSTTLGVLMGLFVARVDVAHGRMITGGQLSYLDTGFVRDFLAVRTPLPFHVYDAAAEDMRAQTAASSYTPAVAAGLRYDSCRLDLGDRYLAQIRNHPTQRGDSLLVLDEMCGGGLLLRRDGPGFRLAEFLEVDSARRDTFVRLSPRLYEFEKSSLRYMPLDAIFMPDGGLAMSYSLPLVFADSAGRRVNLFNAITLLYKPHGAKCWTTLTGMDRSHMEEYMDQHYAIFPLSPGRIVMTCHKMVWPLDDPHPGDPQRDIYLDTFYAQPNPYVDEVDLRTGGLVQRFGQLDEAFHRTYTGYWFANLVADTHGGDFIYGADQTGRLTLARADRPEQALRTYEVFSLGDPAPADTTLRYKDEYMQQYAGYFRRTVAQVKLDDRYVNCLVRTGQPGEENATADHYEFVRLSRESGKVVERYRLCPQRPDERVLAYGLTADAGDNRPFYLARSGAAYFIKYLTPAGR